MSRVAQVLKSKLILVVAAVIIIVVGVSIGVYSHDHSANVHTITNAQHQITQISYRGQNGIDALTLLKEHATIQTKKYSFGYFVASIDGVTGNGPKFWTLYVNNKESSVGGNSYISKNSDTITWKLQ